MTDERKHPLAHCEECPLRNVGRFVPSDGPEHASVAFVGEAPGAQETRSGKPFTGPSGKLLNAVMGHHGINREDVLLTNACLCRPPGNDTPPKLAIQACRPRLLGELDERGVGVAVALGNSAAESLLNQSGVTKLRVGPGRPSPFLPDLRVISTLHPAACLRQADFFPHLVTDVGKVTKENVVWNEPTFVVADTEVDALNLLEQVDARTDPSKGGTGELVVDIEVDVEKDTAFDHPNRYGMLCVGICYAKGKVLVLGEGAMGSQQVRDRLGLLLRARKLIGQNLKFDLAGLYPILGKLKGFFDTMLASYVFDERPGIHALKFQGVEYLGTPQWDNEIKRYVGRGVGYGAIPRPILYRYNAFDCATTYDLFLMWKAKFESHPDGAQLRRVHDFLVDASNELMYLELNGIAVDTSELNDVAEEMTAELAVVEEEIDKIVARSEPHDFDNKRYHIGINPRSPLQVTKYLKTRGVEVQSTNEDTINLLIDKLKDTGRNAITHGAAFDNKDELLAFCNALLVHRKQAKFYGTYIKGTSKRLYRGRVYPTFLLHGTTTGRLSCRNPNLQNVPRGSSIRRLFVPSKPDHVFVQTDYSQAELRVLSYLAGDTYFRDIFNEGVRDLFDDLTPIVFPFVDLATKHTDPAEWKELRVRVKAFVYGLAYGRTAEGLAAEYDFSITEARTARDNFFTVIPEIVEFLQDVRSKVRAGSDLVTPWGRHRRFGLITKENFQDVMNQAQAFMPQSTASDMCLKAMIDVRQQTAGWAWIRNIVHDSLLIEVHQDRVQDVVEIAEKAMIDSFDYIVGGYVKGAVESKTGKSWGDV